MRSTREIINPRTGAQVARSSPGRTANMESSNDPLKGRQSANAGCCYRKARSRLYQIFRPDYFVVAVGAFSPSTGPTVEDFPTDTREATN